jgi:malonyl CoA-acyl carrier protein transacylase/acyl carrier protein
VLDQTYITQPALFTIEYALAKLWMAWGVHPVAMVGHSIGEYVAACLAGVFSLEDALSLVAARGRLMQELPPGSMLAVFLSEKEIEPLLGENLSLAVINGPSLCVVSGEKEAVEDLEKRLSNKNVDCRHVHTSHAFHSKMMEPILDTFTERINKISRNAPQIPFVSNVTGTWITSEEAMDASYWARHLRQTVRFSDCMQELLKEPNRVFLEVGPGRTFSTLTEQHPSRTKDQIVLSSTRHPKEKKSDEAFILGTLGQLWLAGIPVDWPGFYANERRHHLPLPTYPFEGQRYWSGAEEQGHITAAVKPSPLKELTEVASSKLMHPEQETGDARVDSGSNVEQILADIWRRTLGVKQVDFGENFFDLGGTSLIAVRLFADIEKILGRKLPISTLYKAPTLGQLASILRGYEGTASWTSLVEMQHGNSELPIFFIHGAGGDVLVFRDLIHRLGPDLHAYGLQARGLDGEQPFYTRIEDMATQYVQEIQTVQPNGPYLLAGFCMGGTVALEMALQLQAQGQKVALLVLLETYNWGNISDTTWLDRVFYNLEKFGFDCRRLLSEWQYPGLFRTRIALTYERMKPRLGEKLHLGKERHSYHYLLEKSNDRSVVYYMPKTAYQGRIVQFVPAKECACYNRPDARWDTVAVGGVELYKLPLYRRQMFTEPFVSLLAEKLKVCIRKTLDQEAKVRK